jgi:hypothetical protein
VFLRATPDVYIELFEVSRAATARDADALLLAFRGSIGAWALMAGERALMTVAW